MNQVFDKRAAEIASFLRKERGPAPLLVMKGDAAVLCIYEAIGEAFGGVSSKAIADQLGACQAKQLDVFISSEGGDSFEGLAIFNMISRFPGKKTTCVDGIAASAASIILMAGDERLAMPNSQVMIHSPWSIGAGTAADLRQLADVLEKADGNIADLYAKRCGLKAEDVRAMMAATTYFTADEALAGGLVDRVCEPMAPADPKKKMPAARAGSSLSALDIARLRSRAVAGLR